jgi:hypothetical protein
MDQGWAAVIAAAAAGLFGIGGALAGIVVGRRQTQDQAHVEHGQWLRGQRQAAYIALLEGWDAEISALRDAQESWDARVLAWTESGGAAELPGAGTRQTLTTAAGRIRNLVERVDLLGPRAANEAMRELEDAFVAVRDEINAQIDRDQPFVDWDVWYGVLNKAAIARTGFHVAAADVLRTPPTAKGEPLL